MGSETTIVFDSNEVVVEVGKPWTDSEDNRTQPIKMCGGDAIARAEEAEQNVIAFKELLAHKTFNFDNLEKSNLKLRDKIKNLEEEKEKLLLMLGERDLAIMSVLDNAKDTVWIDDYGTLQDCIELWEEKGTWQGKDIRAKLSEDKKISGSEENGH